MKKRQKLDKDEENNFAGDDDAPPILQPEQQQGSSAFEEVVIAEGEQTAYAEDGTYVLGEEYFVDNGVLYKHGSAHPQQQSASHQEARGLDFDDYVRCALCGEVYPYDQLLNEHYPLFHPEVVGPDGVVELEEIPDETWQMMQRETKPHLGVSRYVDSRPTINRPIRSTRTLRRISQIRVNINEMSLEELEVALKKKMVEKMSRQVPVELVDKQHSKCGLCGAIISLNKKFEVVHLVRHFNAWHPAAHKCTGTWLSEKDVSAEGLKPLSTKDFAVIDTNVGAPDNLQCIWCGMFMDENALAMHFHEIHPEEVEVPKCNLCLKELVVNARLTEKFGEDFSITMPDERHFLCGKFDTRHTDEKQLDKAIEKHMRKLHNGGGLDIEENEDEDDQGDETSGKRKSEACDAFSNSRMTFGRRSKPKRQFIQPSLRQATPINSQYVEPVSECHWRCKLCNHDIFAAVISAGAIRHFRSFHQNQLKSMQFELCKTRLERVSDGCMEFMGNNPTTIECLLCQMTFPLHRPFNMCRAIRHLKAKHPEKMPEYKAEIEDKMETSPRKRKYEPTMDSIDDIGLPGTSKQSMANKGGVEADNVVYAEEVMNPETLDMLRQNYTDVEFQRAYAIYGGNVTQRIYMLTNEGDEVDEEIVTSTIDQIASQFGGTDQSNDEIIVVQYPRDNQGDQTAIAKNEVGDEVEFEAVSPKIRFTPYLTESSLPGPVYGQPVHRFRGYGRDGRINPQNGRSPPENFTSEPKLSFGNRGRDEFSEQPTERRDDGFRSEAVSRPHHFEGQLRPQNERLLSSDHPSKLDGKSTSALPRLPPGKAVTPVDISERNALNDSSHFETPKTSNPSHETPKNATFTMTTPPDKNLTDPARIDEIRNNTAGNLLVKRMEIPENKFGSERFFRLSPNVPYGRKGAENVLPGRHINLSADNSTTIHSKNFSESHPKILTEEQRNPAIMFFSPLEGPFSEEMDESHRQRAAESQQNVSNIPRTRFDESRQRPNARPLDRFNTKEKSERSRDENTANDTPNQPTGLPNGIPNGFPNITHLFPQFPDFLGFPAVKFPPFQPNSPKNRNTENNEQ
ncbi:hypothetical protein DdX_04707 [Ditylenchus destructor]|uniref:C2H2-type domain-containing protein n=1 Tax=Ditylenchus destructor TaxID=166010 RepID=A0AAD4R3S5_9BILA|nr:hypothetical protein DdX_04707 [Ditylenchus destructor]